MSVCYMISDCVSPLGMEEKTIPDSAITATTAVSKLQNKLFLDLLQVFTFILGDKVLVDQINEERRSLSL